MSKQLTKEELELQAKNIRKALDLYLMTNRIEEDLFNKAKETFGDDILEEYIEFHKKYQALSPSKYKALLEKKPEDLDMELYIKLNYPKSYQSNIEEIEEVSKLIQGGEKSDNIEKLFKENKPTLESIKEVDTMVKFRKIILSINEGKKPKIVGALENMAISSIASNVVLKQRIIDMSIESVTATNRAKNWYCLWRFSNKTSDEIINKYKWSCSKLTYEIIRGTFLQLVERFPK